MAVATASSSQSSKVLRINDEEKTVLFRLRSIYATDYKNYCKHIKTQSNIPISVKKIYNTLDERQAYRRIADYFHRKRIGNKRNSRRSYIRKTGFHPSTCNITQIQRSIIDDKLEYKTFNIYDNHHEQSNNQTIKTNSDALIDNQLLMSYDDNVDEDDETTMSETSSILYKRYTVIKNRDEPMVMPRISQSSTNLKTNLLSVRTSIEQALHEIDRALLNSDSINQQQSILNKKSISTNSHSQRKLDDIIRSLSNAVNQQQDTVRTIMNESSILLSNENKRLDNRSTIKQESFKRVRERLSNLVDRGNSIFEKVEKVLSQF